MSFDPHSRAARAACKILAAALLLGIGGPVCAADGQPYDVFAKALAPVSAAVFGSNGETAGAMVAECLVTDASGPLAPAEGVRFRLAVQAPDHLRIDVAANGTILTACRNGNEVWALPAETMGALAKAAGLEAGKQGPADESTPPLVPIALDAKMLAFLPLVFDVKDLGYENDPPLRVLEFALLPDARNAIKAPEFTARAWIASDYRPARIAIQSAGYAIGLQVEKINFADRLPDAAWQPPEGSEPSKLPATALNDLFQKMLGAKLPQGQSPADSKLMPQATQ